MLMMRAFWLIAWSMPLRIANVLASTLPPAALNARIARMRAAGATPLSRERAAIVPAIAVPWA